MGNTKGNKDEEAFIREDLNTQQLGRSLPFSYLPSNSLLDPVHSATKVQLRSVHSAPSPLPSLTVLVELTFIQVRKRSPFPLADAGAQVQPHFALCRVWSPKLCMIVQDPSLNHEALS